MEVRVARARPVLAALGHRVHHLGLTPAGTVAKLAVNALFGIQVAALGELLGFARLGELDPRRLVDALSGLPVLSAAAAAAAQAMLGTAFAPQFPLALVAKDFDYVVRSAEAFGAEVPLTLCTQEIFVDAARTGLGAENITAITKRYR